MLIPLYRGEKKIRKNPEKSCSVSCAHACSLFRLTYVLVSVLFCFSLQYFDYVSKVLLPEALAKICMDVHGISHQDAVKFLAETQSASFCM